MMKTKMKFKFSTCAAIVLLMLFAVSCTKSYENREHAGNFLDKHTVGAISAETQVVKEMERGSNELPKRFQNPSFLLEEAGSFSSADAFSVPVGADISSNRGPVALRDILKRLAVLKQMNVSWADDVDQKALVDVDIRAEDDYYRAIENILRQLDYFYEIEGNSIVVKYRDTKVFHLAMPFLKQTYTSGVGGDVLGSADKGHEMKGLIDLISEGSSENSFNIWDNVETNLQAILKYSEETDVEDSVDMTQDSSLGEPSAEGVVEESVIKTASTVRTKSQGALGYYMIDKPVGLITVTAPRTLLGRVESYVESLKKVVYRQISIEAKIVEVTLTGDTRTGLDWKGLLGGANGVSGSLDMQHNLTNWRKGMDYEQFLSFQNVSFNVLLDAMESQGHVEVLANPRVSVMNGQPSLISVGTNEKYVSEVSVERDEFNRKTYTVDTESVVSGVGLAVIATIMDDDEVVLHLTPITSQLAEDIFYKKFDEMEVGLPITHIREMSTTVRVKSGEMLVVGGLIDSNNKYTDDKVTGAGDLPLVDKLFGIKGQEYTKKEMVILLRPVIVN